MDYKELTKELSINIIFDAYLFISNDDYITDSYVNLIKSKVLNKDFAIINENVFSEKRIDINSLEETLNTLPVMSDKRLVVIKCPDLDANDELTSFLSNYLENICPATLLIVYTNKCKASSKIYKSFDKNFRLVQFDKLRGIELETWAKNTFEKKGYEIKKEALSALIQAIDYNSRSNEADMGVFASEINKIISYADKKKTITLDMVTQCVSININEDMYKYCDCLIQGDLYNAYIQLDKLIYNKANPQYILSQAESVMKDRALFSYLKAKGVSEAAIAGTQKVHSYRVKKALTQKGISGNIALKAIKEIYNTDKTIKSGLSDAVTALYTMTEKICTM